MHAGIVLGDTLDSGTLYHLVRADTQTVFSYKDQ